jgi:anaerobic ribonucleoside-triphosphate reductase activating protein
MDSNIIYVMDIKHDTIVDGEGFRSSIYCSLCTHHCFNCHNPETWELHNGKPMTVDEIYKELISNKETNTTFTGGDPMFQCRAFAKLAKKIKENTNKTIWIYSGFTYEEIIQDEDKFELLKLCDVLVDGKFVQEEYDPNLAFRGSKSQRIINIPESLAQNKVILYME